MVDAKSGGRSESPPPRLWWTLLSLVAGFGGCCGGLGTLVTGLDSTGVGRTGGFGHWAPGVWQGIGVFGFCILMAASLCFAIKANRLCERWRGLRVFGFVCNGVMLALLLLAGIQIWHDLAVAAMQKKQSTEQQRFEELQHAHDSKNLRLNLTHLQPSDQLKLTHVTWKAEYDNYRKVGSPGKMDIATVPPGLSVEVAWPEARTFEMTVDFDSKETNLRIEVANLRDTSAFNDRKEIGLPIDLPAGNHHIVIKGRCP